MEFVLSVFISVRNELHAVPYCSIFQNDQPVQKQQHWKQKHYANSWLSVHLPWGIKYVPFGYFWPLVKLFLHKQWRDTLAFQMLSHPTTSSSADRTCHSITPKYTHTDERTEGHNRGLCKLFLLKLSIHLFFFSFYAFINVYVLAFIYWSTYNVVRNLAIFA